MYQASQNRYCVLPYRRCGDSGLLLPAVSLDSKIKPICGDTTGAMLSGSILGAASMLDGMIDRFCEVIGEAKTVVACGGLAPMVIPHCRRRIILDEGLLLSGLLAVYRKNR